VEIRRCEKVAYLAVGYMNAFLARKKVWRMSGENRASGMRVERGAFREHVLIYRGHGVSSEFQRSKPEVVLRTFSESYWRAE
jgi:hypothetical protein